MHNRATACLKSTPFPKPATQLLAILTFCVSAIHCQDPTPAPVCTEFFGTPNETTGLTEDMCSPTCGCEEDAWTAPTYGDDVLETLRSKSLAEPAALLTEDPYENPPTTDANAQAFCAVLYSTEARTDYTLVTYASETEAQDAGAIITHRGACGACSTLADLAVYITYPDLTTPVRECGFQGISGGEETNLTCLGELGFTEACAQIWYYNTANTRRHCLAPCIELISAAYNTADGSLNECLQCDEDQSGDTFKAIAGRTRRNSGLPTAICRPCDGVYRLTHAY